MPHIDISEDIALAQYVDRDDVPTEFGKAVLRFIAKHFDVYPLTGYGSDAISDVAFEGDDRRHAGSK